MRYARVFIPQGAKLGVFNRPAVNSAVRKKTRAVDSRALQSQDVRPTEIACSVENVIEMRSHRTVGRAQSEESGYHVGAHVGYPALWKVATFKSQLGYTIESESVLEQRQELAKWIPAEIH